MKRGRHSIDKHDGSTTFAMVIINRPKRTVSGVRTQLDNQRSRCRHAGGGDARSDAGSPLRGDVAGDHEEQQQCEDAGGGHHPSSADILYERVGSGRRHKFLSAPVPRQSRIRNITQRCSDTQHGVRETDASAGVCRHQAFALPPVIMRRVRLTSTTSSTISKNMCHVSRLCVQALWQR